MRKAGDIDAVRAALPTLFKGFTFDGLIETEPREEAIIGFHFLRDDEGVATEPFVRKTPARHARKQLFELFRALLGPSGGV